MLPAAHRMRRTADFTRAFRSGRRVGSRLVVLHCVETDEAEGNPVRIGFIVNKAVGTAVVRNRVKRRLRHQVAARVDRLGTGRLYVVRANPAAATASAEELGQAVDRCLAKLGTGRGGPA